MLAVVLLVLLATAMAAGECEVCHDVVEGLYEVEKAPCWSYLGTTEEAVCHRVMESAFHWMEHVEYWTSAGCEQVDQVMQTWMKPCPKHAVCSWLQDLETGKPLCSPDPKYPAPR